MADASHSNLGKILALIFLIGMIVFIIGFATTYWSDYDIYHRGLWETCSSNGVCVGGSVTKVLDVLDDDNISWFEAVQAFETLGFIAGIVALILIILYVFVPATSGKKIVSILSMLAAFAAAGCIILGIIIYGAKSHDLSWSFALCTIGGVLFGIAGLLLAIDMMKR